MQRPESIPPIVILLMGVSGSGKTEVGRLLAREIDGDFLDADSLHPPENVALMRHGIPLDDPRREPWLAAVAEAIRDRLPGTRRLVVACSALKKQYRQRLGLDDGRIRLVHLTGSPDLIRERITGRSGHFMPPALLESQLATLEPPGPDEHPIVVDVAAPPAALVAAITAALAQR